MIYRCVFIMIIFVILSSCLLLVSPITGFPDSNSSIILDPPKLMINGTLGKDSFHGIFYITAVGRNISNLTFEPGSMKMNNLSSSCAPNIFIPSASIQVSGKKDIIMGQTREYELSVNNIPGSGVYVGKLDIGYDKQPIGKKDGLQIVLLAYKLNASPSSLILNFENGIIMGLGGTDNANRTLELNGETGKLPPDIAKDMISGLNVTMSELVNEDKSLRINSLDILELNRPPIKYGKDGCIEIDSKFINGQFTPGKYTGSLVVQLNGSLQPIAVIPVELRVRSNKWLAFFLIFLGVAGYLIFNNWNTTGRERNDINRRVSKIRDDIRESVSGQCQKKIEGLLSEVDEHINDKKLDDVQKKMENIESEMKTCKEAKKKLDNAANNAKDLINKLDELEGLAEDELKKWEIDPKDSNLIQVLIPDILAKLNHLRNNKIAKVSDVDEKVWDDKTQTEKSINDLFKEYNENVQDLSKLIEDSKELGEDLDSDKLSRESKKIFKDCAKENEVTEFKEINEIDDIKKCSDNIKNRKEQVADNKNGWKESIDKYNELCQKLKNGDLNDGQKSELDRIKKDICSYTKVNDILNRLTAIENNKIPESGNKSKPERGMAVASLHRDHPQKLGIRDLSPESPDKPEIKDLSPDSSKVEKLPKMDREAFDSWRIEAKEGDRIKWTAEAFPILPDLQTRFMFILNGNELGDWKSDNTWIWIPGRNDEMDNRLEVRAKYKGKIQEASKFARFEWSRKKKNHMDKILDATKLPEFLSSESFLSPEWNEMFMKATLWGFATIILTYVGYAQLYAGNPTFGAGNTAIEYSTLIFWGFGIQASTSKAVDIVKAFTGS